MSDRICILSERGVRFQATLIDESFPIFFSSSLSLSPSFYPSEIRGTLYLQSVVRGYPDSRITSLLLAGLIEVSTVEEFGYTALVPIQRELRYDSPYVK